MVGIGQSCQTSCLPVASHHLMRPDMTSFCRCGCSDNDSSDTCAMTTLLSSRAVARYTRDRRQDGEKRALERGARWNLLSRRYWPNSYRSSVTRRVAVTSQPPLGFCPQNIRWSLMTAIKYTGNRIISDTTFVSSVS